MKSHISEKNALTAALGLMKSFPHRASFFLDYFDGIERNEIFCTKLGLHSAYENSTFFLEHISLVQDQYLVPWPDKLYFAIDLPNASATSAALTWRLLSLSPPRSPGIQDSPRMSPAKKKV